MVGPEASRWNCQRALRYSRELLRALEKKVLTNASEIPRREKSRGLRGRTRTLEIQSSIAARPAHEAVCSDVRNGWTWGQSPEGPRTPWDAAEPDPIEGLTYSLDPAIWNLVAERRTEPSSRARYAKPRPQNGAAAGDG